MIDEYPKLILIENIFNAWRNFSLSKTGKKEVADFWRNLEDNLFKLHNGLKEGFYKPGRYKRFIVRDPKERIIHKANVRDRIVHQLIYDYLRPIFEKRFIFDSYSSRIGKGTHRAVKRLHVFCCKISNGGRRSCWILKCDIRKFFDSVDHNILFSFIEKRIDDKQILKLISKIIKSYGITPGEGLPLGNLTSQLFANIYLHEFDYFIKHVLHLKHYIRFNDDFIIAHQNRDFLELQIPIFKNFLAGRLSLNLPDNKIIMRKFDWGVDFLGYIVLPGGILLRTKTKKRIFKKLRQKIEDYKIGRLSCNKFNQIATSYLGILKHCSGFKLRQMIFNFSENIYN